MAIIRTSKEISCDKKGYRVWNVKIRKKEFGHLIEKRELVIASKNRSEAVKQIDNEFGQSNVIDIRRTVRMVDLSI